MQILDSQMVSSVSGQWNSFEETQGGSERWDDIEHVGLGMPTTWNVIRDNDNSHNANFEAAYTLPSCCLSPKDMGHIAAHA